MGYDAARQRLVVFGGDRFDSDSLGPSDDTWEFDGSNWARRYVTTWPSPRVMAAMSYDSARGEFVLMGGDTEVAPDVALDDTWVLSPMVNAAGAGLSVDAVNFGQRPVLTTTTRSVLLVNSGSAPALINGIAATSPFSMSDNCPRSPSTLAVNASCVLNVSFTPTGAAAVSGALSVTDNAGTGTQTIPLFGSGFYGYLAVDPASLSFAATGMTMTSSVVVTLTAPAQGTRITGFDASAPFGVTNLDCSLTSPLSFGQSCHIRVDFTPPAVGSFTGQVVIHDNEPGLQHTISAAGVGIPIPASATLTVAPIAPNSAAEFSDTVHVSADITASDGTATFSVAGHALPAVSFSNHLAAVDITLDDSVVSGGAGNYMLAVAIHSADPAYSDGSSSTLIAVSPESGFLAWSGPAFGNAGEGTTLAVSVTQPAQDLQPFDYADHAVFARFDVTSPDRMTTSYFAPIVRASNYAPGLAAGTASVAGPTLADGAYLVHVTLVKAPDDASASPYLASQGLYATFGGHPATTGYMAGGGTIAGQAAAFEFEPGHPASGSLRWVRSGAYTTADGMQHAALYVATATGVTSVDSHSHLATATGTAAVVIRDATSDAVFAAGAPTGYTVSVDSSGAATLSLADGSMSAAGSFAPGGAINHL
jgi:hypothetical protein